MTKDVGTTVGSPLGDWPLFGLTDDVRPVLRSELDSNRPVALVTLFAAEGGAPRGVGAQMLVTADGASGYLSGGCVEADIALHGRAVIADGVPRRLVYGRGGPIDIRLPCGGRIEVLVERVVPGDPAAARLLAFAERRTPALWLTDGEKRMCVAEDEFEESALAGSLFARRHLPRQRVVILGSDPVALALAGLAAQTGAEVILNRPNGPVAPPPFPVEYVRSSPTEALAAARPDPWTAIIVALHDETNDHEALVAALPSDAGYVGLLGSTRRLPQKLERLRAAGLTARDIQKLKAPVGLPLGGKAPWEIAVAIVAGLIKTASASNRSTIVLGHPKDAGLDLGGHDDKGSAAKASERVVNASPRERARPAFDHAR